MSEQISLFDSYDWKSETAKMLEKLVEELELPKGSLLLIENKARLSDATTSYAVNIYEPEYPKIPNAKKDETRNSIVLRIEEKKNRNIEGTGLGMAIAQSFLNMMDSKIQVESQYGKGSVFSFD